MHSDYSKLRKLRIHCPDADELGLHQVHSQIYKKAVVLKHWNCFRTFCMSEGRVTRKEMSSPVTAFESCSRLSAHLALVRFQCVKFRTHVNGAVEEIKQMPRGMKGKWPSALRSFSGRLRWHCHFIQKLEDEPRIEFENMHPAYDGLRENAFNETFFEAWKAGKTGYPMVDACMRALKSTGWLNFRMRAMVMSFASYHLWLHWRRPALHLPSFSLTMSPAFTTVRRKCNRVPLESTPFVFTTPSSKASITILKGFLFVIGFLNFASMDQAFIHTPWLAKSQMGNYPMPVIDEKDGRKAAASKLYGLRKNSKTHKATAEKIVNKHGSRKSGLPRTTGRHAKNNNQQGELPLMSTLRLILGDQLSDSISSLSGCDQSRDIIFMCEVWDEATYVKHHKKKIAFLFSAMRHFSRN
jgi:deoxyribodipyrimidine photo-lyase